MKNDDLSQLLLFKSVADNEELTMSQDQLTLDPFVPEHEGANSLFELTVRCRLAPCRPDILR
ncbi:MAG: hypothetical protein ACR65R_08150 [Methylomicrobium sp.]